MLLMISSLRKKDSRGLSVVSVCKFDILTMNKGIRQEKRAREGERRRRKGQK
jgi:hypothetical protein